MRAATEVILAFVIGALITAALFGLYVARLESGPGLSGVTVFVDEQGH